MHIKVILVCFSFLIANFVHAKGKQQIPSKVEVTVKGPDAKKVYELLKDRETEKGAEEVGTSYYSKYGKGVQCLRYRGTKNDADDKNYECVFEINAEGIILEPNPHY